MKLVKKDQTIENIIIQQNPPIESLHITEEKLCKILNDLGKRCLIILDGFDEYDPQPWDDIRYIIEGRQLRSCSLVVTSRPHNCEKIERYFSTKAKVNGFTKTRAEKFASNVLNDREKVEAVCKISGRNFHSPDEYSNPMLLVFLCILEKYDELDLSQTVVSLGEIYFRLIRCMYRKYCVRKGIEFDDGEFIQVLRRVEKVAWEMLDSGTNFAKQREIFREVGSDAFEYGLFAGHKDLRLAATETKDIFVVFVHQTIQEFLGAFHCICEWNTAGRVHISNRFPPLEFYFLRFCLWLLSDKCSYIQIDKSEDLFMALVHYVTEKINFVQVDLTDFSFMFTELEMSKVKNQDDLLFHFMTRVLLLCENVKELFVNSSDPIERILEALSSSVPSLVLVATKTAFLNGNDYFRPDHLDICENQLVVLENTTPYLGMAHVLNRFHSKPLALVILANQMDEDLTEFCHECLNKFHICGLLAENLTAKNDFPHCSSLTELCISNLHVEESVLNALSLAVDTNHLPTLNRLTFKSCGSSLKGKLHMLFQSTWPKLTHLHIHQCPLENCDIQLFSRDKQNKFCLLPNLTSVTIDLFGYVDCLLLDGPLISILKTTWRELTNLALFQATKKVYREVVSLLNSNNLPRLTQLSFFMRSHVEKCKMEMVPSEGQQSDSELPPVNLSALTFLSLQKFVNAKWDLVAAALSAKFSTVQKLDISHSSHITGKLIKLVDYRFRSLKALILSNCGLDFRDLRSLSEASARSKLPELRHLDLSQNSDIQGQLKNLFFSEERWSNLLFFNIQQNSYSRSMDDVRIIFYFVRSGCLSSLTQLQTSITHMTSICDYLDSPWRSLTALHLTLAPNSSCTLDELLRAIGQNVQKELFPKLRQIWLIVKKADQLGNVSNEPIPMALLEEEWDYLSHRARTAL